ncbi:MAG: PEGA domain-containing protein, partial [Candidatus Omnitrophica bacterium]|nr:PEGA domain-containing protein [Candidatus Omnitrophota bacterium]
MICPVVIMYALGYILKPDTKTPIALTGDIHIATAPPGASIVINGKLYPENTPTLIEKLNPGPYKIDVILRRYKPWSRVVPVIGEKATVLDSIILMPEKWDSVTVSEGGYKNLIPLEGTPFILFVKDDTLGGYTIYDTAQKKSHPLVDPDSEYSKMEVVSCMTGKKSTYTAFILRSAGGTRIVWLDVSGKSGNPPVDITEFFTVLPKKLIWHGENQRYIFYKTDSSINRVDMDAGAVYPEYVTGVTGFGISGGAVYILDKDDGIYSMDYDRKNKTPIIEGAKKIRSVFNLSGSYSIIPLPGNIMLFTGTGGELIANKIPYTFVESGLLGYSFDRRREKLLVWKKDSIGILDFTAEATGDVAFEKPP